MLLFVGPNIYPSKYTYAQKRHIGPMQIDGFVSKIMYIL